VPSLSFVLSPRSRPLCPCSVHAVLFIAVAPGRASRAYFWLLSSVLVPPAWPLCISSPRCGTYFSLQSTRSWRAVHFPSFLFAASLLPLSAPLMPARSVLCPCPFCPSVDAAPRPLLGACFFLRFRSVPPPGLSVPFARPFIVFLRWVCLTASSRRWFLGSLGFSASFFGVLRASLLGFWSSRQFGRRCVPFSRLCLRPYLSPPSWLPLG